MTAADATTTLLECAPPTQMQDAVMWAEPAAVSGTSHLPSRTAAGLGAQKQEKQQVLCGQCYVDSVVWTGLCVLCGQASERMHVMLCGFGLPCDSCLLYSDH